MLPGGLVKKDNQLIRTRVSIDGVVAGRVLASLIACLKADGSSGNEVSINAKNFLSDMPNGSDYAKLKTLVSSLAGSFAELVQLDRKKNDFVIKAITFFSEIEYNCGMIKAKFNSSVYPLLVELKRGFTKYNLIEFLQLPSLYSQRIFEILKSYENMDKDSFEISLLDLHRMLNIPDSLRRNFKDFRIRILERAELDINKKTTLRFTWEAMKTGRKVTSVKFIFTGKIQKKLNAAKAKEETKKGKKALATLTSPTRRPTPGPQVLGDLLAPEASLSLDEQKKAFREKLAKVQEKG